VKESVMAKAPSKSTIEESITVALDAADTAATVTEEFNGIKEQFEVVNIQAKRIYQSVLIIFVSSIIAASVSGIAAFTIYFKSLSELDTSNRMAIESIAIFTERVGALETAMATVETNTKNQETIKNTLDTLQDAALKASDDLASADQRYNQAIKIGVTETERLINQFTTSTLSTLSEQVSEDTAELRSLVAEMRKLAEVSPDEAPSQAPEMKPEIDISTPVEADKLDELKVKFDEMLLLQKEIAAKLLEMERKARTPAKTAKVTKKPTQTKKAENPLKFP
jgi:hypothetical protein